MSETLAPSRQHHAGGRTNLLFTMSVSAGGKPPERAPDGTRPAAAAGIRL